MTFPFMISPLFDDIGHLDDGSAVNDIVDDGWYTPPPGTDPYASEFIEVLSMLDSIQEKGGIVECI